MGLKRERAGRNGGDKEKMTSLGDGLGAGRNWMKSEIAEVMLEGVVGACRR